MAVISFSTADVMRSKLLEKGWYHFQISDVKIGPNKNKDGVNYTVIFTLVDAADKDLEGKELQRVFSNKAISMMIPLVAAVRGLPQDQIPKEGFNFDTDELKGAKIDGQVETDTYEGQLKNIVETYLPYKKSSNASGF